MDSLDGLDRLLEVEKRASDLMRLAESEASLVIGRAQDETKKVEKKALVDARACARLFRELERRKSHAFAFSEEECPGHVASEHDPKICGQCGIHIDSLR